ncbi:adenylate/guanylate cyclase domain-containing protein [Sneathiella chinensis]|uniref:Adenylate cyclase n=1 Tax=Sneathiella chinensis TaxID=349750 RepID=A0ABQ5U4C0_9PROT|nr:adenylate/guanylate cyclase domain-containing protein [Sneathiella chinensis]GLQ06586.1 adenylate cyclase [Sneathiella chinensis]
MIDGTKHWLLTEGRLLPDPLDFVDTLCRRIRQDGIPLDRLRIGFQTIHPQLDVCTYYWNDTDNKASTWGGEHGIRSSSSYYGSPAEWVHDHKTMFRKRLDELVPGKDHLVLFEQQVAGYTDYIMLPLGFMDGSTSLVTYCTRHKDGFSDQDILDLQELVNYIAPIIEVHATRTIAVTLLDTYTGHRTGERILNGTIQRGSGEAIEAALWFCDLRNFTSISETRSQEEVFGLLNEYFQTVSDALKHRNGEILKFIGDAVLAIFPVTDTTPPEENCQSALEAAEDCLSALKAINVRRQRGGQPEIHVGIGLHFGKALYGNVGAEDRLDFTVMGPAVNLASRLESLTKETGHALLVSDIFASKIDRETQLIGEFTLKGLKNRLAVYSLTP